MKISLMPMIPRYPKLFLVSLLVCLVRLPLLWLVSGEYTDGILQTVYFDSPPDYTILDGSGPAWYVPPLFPILTNLLGFLGVERLLAGRLISLVAHGLCGYLLAAFVKDLTKHRPQLFHNRSWADRLPWLGLIFWQTAPLPHQLSWHGMADMLFAMLMFAAGIQLLKSAWGEEDSKQMAHWRNSQCLGFLATLTRLQGMAFLLATVLSVWRGIYPWRRGQRVPLTTYLLGAGWGITLAVVYYFLGIHGRQFAERSQYPLLLYWDFAETALLYLPYALTPPLFVLALLGVIHLVRHSRSARLWLTLFGVLLSLGWLIQTMFMSFQFRYGLPVVPFVIVLACVGMGSLHSWRSGWIWATLVIGWGGMFCLALSANQSSTFGSLEEVCRYAKFAVPAQKNIWAFEPYNQHYANVKSSFWAGRKVRFVSPQTLPEIQQGDFLLDDTVYTVPPVLMEQLRKIFEFLTEKETLHTARSIFPGDVLVRRAGDPRFESAFRKSSLPALMAERYVPQFYLTTLYRLERKPLEKADHEKQ